jgi:hypothetical protein
MRDELCESLAFLPGRSDPWIWIAKPNESRIKKLICGRSLPTAALPIEGPAENKLCRTIVFSRHPSEPMVNERGFLVIGNLATEIFSGPSRLGGSPANGF